MARPAFILLVLFAFCSEVMADPAMAEVNAARAKRGLPPFVEDPELTKGAQACADYRAARRIAGHTHNDFAFLPKGTAAWGGGAGCADPSWGWMACFTYDRRYQTAGAAFAVGRDGHRYMTLFVR